MEITAQMFFWGVKIQPLISPPLPTLKNLKNLKSYIRLEWSFLWKCEYAGVDLKTCFKKFPLLHRRLEDRGYSDETPDKSRLNIVTWDFRGSTG